MQFADPAWQPKVTREFEAIAPAPTGTSSSGVGATTASQAGEADYDDYAQGYRVQSARSNERENPSQSQPPPLSFQNQQQPFSLQPFLDWCKRLPIWAWWLIGVLVLSGFVQNAINQGGFAGALFSLIFVGALVLVGWLLWTQRVRISLSGETQAAETRTFTVSAQPTIILKNKAGSIKLHAGQEGQVSITTTRRGYLFSQHFDKETPISYNQDSAANTVTARTGSWRLFGKNAINFDVAVPPQANLQLSTNAGNISVENIAGQITLRSDAGTLQATNVALRGKSRLKTDLGTITFSGSLASTGNYELTTDVGTINATLSADSTFDLNAKTDVGTVSTNLPLSQPQRNKASGTVGVGPYPKLKVKTDLGTITIQRQ